MLLCSRVSFTSPSVFQLEDTESYRVTLDVNLGSELINVGFVVVGSICL